MGIDIAVHETPYSQYRHEILNPESALYGFRPDIIVLAVDSNEAGFPDLADEPEPLLQAEVGRWTMLWETIRSRCGARIVQHNFAIPPAELLDHVSARVPGSRYSMLHELNLRLARAAGREVSVVDCDRLSGMAGKPAWFDPKYWFISRQAVALPALPMLAHHTAAVIGSELGLTRKCLVLDLDNTLWGGIIGEDGLEGIRIGGGPEGEAYSHFQRHLLRLKNRGVLLAVCSKNNEADALAPFLSHPDMQLKREDFVAFVANWDSKVDGIRRIASELGIGLDSMVFVDDNPVERQAVRNALPDVDVITLTEEPARYATAVAAYPMFESKWITGEDRRRTEQYRGRANANAAKAAAGSTEDYYRDLRMQAEIGPFDAVHLPRIAQLFGKTSQFNMTTRRHSQQQLAAMAARPNCIHFWLKLRDRFADHGLVAALVAFASNGVTEIDSWVMSCRVIGRTAESAMLKSLGDGAAALGCTGVRGVWAPTAKNQVARDVYEKFGFQLETERDDLTSWICDVAACRRIEVPFIDVTERYELGRSA
jgi:FkbH-like protein